MSMYAQQKFYPNGLHGSSEPFSQAADNPEVRGMSSSNRNAITFIIINIKSTKLLLMIKQVFHGWLLDLDLLIWRDLLNPVFM